MILAAHAKVNLLLRLRRRGADGYHPIRSLAQSIGWSDTLVIEAAEEDALTVSGAVAADEHNLAWRAVAAVRAAVAPRLPVRLHLDKRLPVAAGLGGGSADAAAGLVGATRVLGAPGDTPARLAASLGADVPFCVVGGTAWMEGRGEVVIPVPLRPDYAIAVAAPPFALATAAVYRRWDELEGPTAVGVAGRDLPPSLRQFGPLGNDLLPAARHLDPRLGDWMSDVGAAWTRPVLLTGSGPAVFAFFADDDEVAAATAAVHGAGAVWAGRPARVGVRVVEE